MQNTCLCSWKIVEFKVDTTVFRNEEKSRRMDAMGIKVYYLIQLETTS